MNEYLTPYNARVDILSSSFGRASDFGEDDQSKEKEEMNGRNKSNGIDFSPETAGKPFVEPHFGTQYWNSNIPKNVLDEWSKVAEAQQPPAESKISLPPINPFIPNNFDLKQLSADDGHHPLLFCSLKLCITVGKKKVSVGMTDGMDFFNCDYSIN